MAEKILIVEDDNMLQEWVQYELEGEGYEVVVATTGTAGLQTAQEIPPPDVILLDVQLPGMSGFEIAQKLQVNPQTATIPIIFLTARTTLKDKMTGFEAGGADYLTKPFVMSELKARLKATLNRRQVEQDKARLDLESYKQNLSQNMSHELLTPMAKILSGLDVISRLAEKENNPSFDQSIAIARAGANEMRWLIEDLLLINRLEQRKMAGFRQKIKLLSVVENQIKEISTIYRRQTLQFDYSIPANLTVHTQRRELTHILHHLLDNAAKFSFPEGRVTLTAQGIGEGGVTIKIEDQGPGIAPDYQKKVFDKFYQIDMGISRPKDGLGVGLYLARALARLYEGEVTLDSQVDHGTTVTLTLPDRPADS